LTLQFTLEQECSKKINLDKLAESVGLTRRTFERRFKAATGDTPNLYLQRVRVERAKKMLEEEEMTFEEISYYLGYEDIGSFRKTFIKHTGLRPKQYKRKFQRVCSKTRMHGLPT
jgi:transcriptional regulator GlxA family with amidase domain